MIDEKKALRKRIRLLKKELSEDDKNLQANSVLSQLRSHELYQKAQSILFYWSMADELPTQKFVLDHYKEKDIYLPVINGDDLDIVRFSGPDCLVPGERYGIPEPRGEKLSDEACIDLVIVPGVAFDRNNNRMGRGAGYYDRVLSRVSHASKVALAFNFQMVENVPVESHDVPMDVIIYHK